MSKKTWPFLVVYLRSCWYLLLMSQLWHIWKKAGRYDRKKFFPMASLHVSPFNPQNDSEIPVETSFFGAQGILAIRTFMINHLIDIKTIVAHCFIRRNKSRWKVIHCNKNGMFSPNKTNKGSFNPGLPFCAFFFLLLSGSVSINYLGQNQGIVFF